MYKTMSKQVLLKKQAIKIQKKILNAKINKNYFIYPFDHIIIDNILNEKFAKKVAKSFPDINKKNWEYSNTKDIEVKYRSKWKSEFDIPENVIDLVRILNSSIILSCLSVSDYWAIKSLPLGIAMVIGGIIQLIFMNNIIIR